MGRIMAIDYGKKRTGIAVTDPLRIAATPLETVDTAVLKQWLSDYFLRETVDEVIIGHPVQMNGEDSQSMEYIRPFITWFRQTFTAITLSEVDERFTSVLAHKAMLEGGLKRKQRQDKKTVDRIAACIMLEERLDGLAVRS